jgi:hypothetical protein
MQSLLKLIAWVVIICLAAALMYFGIQVLTQPTVSVPVSSVQPMVIPQPAPPVVVPENTREEIKVEPIQTFSTQPQSTAADKQPMDSEKLAQQAERERRQKIVDETREQATALLNKPGGPSAAEVDQVLAKMAPLMDANGQVSGVNLGALRETVQLSGEIQLIAEKIKKESEKGESADPAVLQENNEKLQLLQQKLLEASSNNKILPGS